MYHFVCFSERGAIVAALANQNVSLISVPSVNRNRSNKAVKSRTLDTIVRLRMQMISRIGEKRPIALLIRTQEGY